MCKYCDDDRSIDCASVYFGEVGKIATINEYSEFVVNIEGNQMNIPIKYCPFCGDKLETYYTR